MVRMQAPCETVLPHLRRRVVGALMAAQALTGLSYGVAYSMGSMLAAKMAGTAWGGVAATGATVGTAIFAIPLARIAANSGRRLSLSIGVAIGLGGLIACFLAAQWNLFPLLLAGFVLLGGSSAVSLQSRFAATDVVPDEHRGRALSLIMWATTFGAVAGPNLFNAGEAIGRRLGVAEFSGAYVISSLATVLAMGSLWWGLNTEVTSSPAVSASRSSAMGNAAARARWFPIAAIGVAHFTMVGLMSMTAVHMHDHGASLTFIGITVSLHVAGMYALSPLFGWCADAWGRIPTLVAGYGMLGVACVLLMFWPADNGPVLSALTLLGVGWSAAVVAASALLVDGLYTALRPAVEGRSDMIMSMSGGIGGLLAGPILAVWGMPMLAAVCGITVLAIASQLHRHSVTK